MRSPGMRVGASSRGRCRFRLAIGTRRSGGDVRRTKAKHDEVVLPSNVQLPRRAFGGRQVVPREVDGRVHEGLGIQIARGRKRVSSPRNPSPDPVHLLEHVLMGAHRLQSVVETFRSRALSRSTVHDDNGGVRPKSLGTFRRLPLQSSHQLHPRNGAERSGGGTWPATR